MAGQQKPMMGLIPAAGKGVRARPYTDVTHKGMLDINGSSNIERIILNMRDNLGISEIVIIIGHLGHTISDHFGDGRQLGVTIHYVENTELDKGWAWSIYLAKDLIDRHFCVMLCDECHIGTNHVEFGRVDYENALVVCTSQRVDDPLLIQKNYAVEHDGVRITELIENPKHSRNNIMGACSFLMSPRIFEFLELEFVINKAQCVEFIDYLNTLIKAGEKVDMFELEGTCININDRDSLALARHLDRLDKLPHCSRGLIVNANNGAEHLRFTLNRYKDLGVFDEILVIAPQSLKDSIGALESEFDNTVLMLFDSAVGIGECLRKGLAKLDRDIIVITEADYSFPARDVHKLLLYALEADVVLGSRTSRQLNEEGTDMRGITRLYYTLIGHLMELMWWRGEGRFSDAGCSFRAVWKNSYESIAHKLEADGPEFLEEMIVKSLSSRLRVIEIPVNYSAKRKSGRAVRPSLGAATSHLWNLLKYRLKP